MKSNLLPTFVSLVAACATVVSNPFANAQDNDPPFVEQFLISGKLDDGAKQLKQKLTATPDSDQLHFELGVLQFFQTIEHFGQSLYSFGPDQNIGLGFLPFLRMPVPENINPEKVTLDDFRGALERMVNDLQEADQTLGKVKSDKVRLPLHVFKFHLDFDKNGKLSADERADGVLQSYLGIRQRANQDFTKVAIDFDRSDAQWLRGYCNLLQAMCETVLAYDQTLFWDTVAHRIFPTAEVKHDFLREEMKGARNRNGAPALNSSGFYGYIADFVAGIHNCQFRIREPDRLRKAHAHLLTMIQHSRTMWELINKETDDQNEWIPSPKQTNPFARQQITQDMTESWEVFLNESEALLKGEKLIPFWRGTNPKRGVNLHKVFHQPKDIDLVICVQGPGMIPFLEEGECTDPQTWRQLQRTFRGDFVGFAIWIN